MEPLPMERAAALMERFADASGLTGTRPPRRYLWTDAHAVCNLLELHRQAAAPHWRELAETLIDQVHDVLGRHRGDDDRRGWISGLSESEGRLHPTAGGLRIGKPDPERRLREAYDPHAEWDRDGQYYHYLTKWVHALQQAATATGTDRYRQWAVELAVAAHRGFRARSGPPLLHWKMSIDLSRPLVPSAGLHDPLDGLVTALVADAGATQAERRTLAPVREDLAVLCRDRDWFTDDPLGLGGLLFDAGRLAQLSAADTLAPGLLARILDAVEAGLRSFLRTDPLALNAEHRLAFRELGLAIGLHAIPLIYRSQPPPATLQQLDRLARHAAMAETIQAFWLDPGNRQASTWLGHPDINAVMLATSQLPQGFLVLGAAR